MAQQQKTVLQIINAVQQELGLPVSATVFGNSDLTTVQLLALLQLANEELRDFNDAGWAVLQTELNLVVNPPITVTGDLGLNSAVITNISPNTTGLAANYWYVSGPTIPQGARILSVDSPTQVTMTMESTGVSPGATIVFAQDTYAMPPDFDFFQNRTWWDRTNRWELLGPDSPQMDQWHRSGIIATGPRRHFRKLGPYANNYRLWPPPSEITEPIQLVYEYISFYSVASAANPQTVFQKDFQTDGDMPMLDDRALIMSVKWRFWEQKGLNWTSKRDEYDTYVGRIAARDEGSATLSLVQRVNPIFLSPANVQDGFFPGPVGPNVA